MDHKHHGAILEAAMKSQGIKIAELARKMKMTRTTLYKRIESEVLDFYELIRFGQALGYDFSNDVPELDMYKLQSTTVNEDTPQYGNKTQGDLAECRKALGMYKDEAYKLARELNTWKDKYIDLTEELASLRMQLKQQ